jgi:hypothetical protein
MRRRSLGLCYCLGKEWQRLCVCERQTQRDAGHLAQQFAAGVFTVSTVNDSVNLWQFHFVDLAQCIDSPQGLVFPLARLAKVLAFGPKPVSVANDLDAEK